MVVMLYVRFLLSLRHVEDLLVERGLMSSRIFSSCHNKPHDRV